ncbi:hypothetical protein ADUPG1_001413, partial [Aduncisulcus paluster]
MVAMVLGQSVTNNEVVRSSAGLSSRMFTLRRILHRDLQNVVPGKLVGVSETGLTFDSSNSIMVENAGPVIVSWDFSSNMIRRSEKSSDLDFEYSKLLMRGLKSWSLELLDIKKIFGFPFRSNETVRILCLWRGFLMLRSSDGSRGVVLVIVLVLFMALSGLTLMTIEVSSRGAVEASRMRSEYEAGFKAEEALYMVYDL